MITKRQMLGYGAVLVGLGFTVGGAQAEGYESLPMSLAEMQASGGLIVDIRAAEEWADTGVIAGAKLVTFADADSFLAAVGPDLADGRPLLLVCRSGRRSAAAAEALAGKIPNRIVSVDGGMGRLIDEGVQTVAP